MTYMDNKQLQQEIIRLQQEIDNIKRIISKDDFSDLKIFVKNVQFKSNINIQNLPTSSSGLVTGDLYNSSGTLKVA